jgi:hypothetical protein
MIRDCSRFSEDLVEDEIGPFCCSLMENVEKMIIGNSLVDRRKR